MATTKQAPRKATKQAPRKQSKRRVVAGDSESENEVLADVKPPEASTEQERISASGARSSLPRSLSKSSATHSRSKIVSLVSSSITGTSPPTSETLSVATVDLTAEDSISNRITRPLADRPRISTPFIVDETDQEEIQRLSQSVETIIPNLEATATILKKTAANSHSVYSPLEATKATIQEMPQSTSEVFTEAIIQPLSNTALLLSSDDFEAETTKRREETRTQDEIDSEDNLTHKSTTTSSMANTNATSNEPIEDGHKPQVAATADEEPVPGAEYLRNHVGSERDSNLPERFEPKAADEILTAVAKSTRKTFVKGDAAIIIRPDDWSETWLIPSSTLSRDTSIMVDLMDSNDPAELKYLFILEANENSTKMPRLRSLKSNIAVQGLLDCTTLSYIAPRSLPEMKLKTESGEGITQESATSRIDWVKAYEVFLAIIMGSKAANQRFVTSVVNSLGANATSALPQIEGLIEIANHYHAPATVTFTLSVILLRYIGNATLYDAIAAQAASWLLIGWQIQDEFIYREAFCHLAGRFPDWPWEKPLTALPKQVQIAIEHKSRDLEYLRISTNNALARVTVKAKGSPVPVSQRMNPLKYNVVNFWYHWLSEHLAYIDEDEGERAESTDFCDHVNRDCLSKAGIYRAIYRGGDSYLPIDEVLKKWDKAQYIKGDEEIRQTLNVIKAEAAKIAAPLAQSSLRYDRKDALDYLTCIVVRDEEIPWKLDEQDVEMGD